MELFTAGSEVERQMRKQFEHSPLPDDPERNTPRHQPRQAALRQHLSAALRALARAIEPPRPATDLRH